jgi:hypothetical protein
MNNTYVTLVFTISLDTVVVLVIMVTRLIRYLRTSIEKPGLPRLDPPPSMVRTRKGYGDLFALACDDGPGLKTRWP